MRKDSVWVVVPTLEERRNLAILIPQLLNLNPAWRVLIVDDGSQDGTQQFLAKKWGHEPRLSLLLQETRGFGSALREGMAYALEHGATRIVTMDGDLSHDPRDIPRLLRESTDLVLGSRYVDGGEVVGWPRRRKVISYVANRLSRFSLGAAERDLTTGFRAYSQAMARVVVREASGKSFNFQVEVVNLAKKHRMQIAEVPIKFRERRWGESKLSSTREAASLMSFLTTRSPLRLFLVVSLLAALVNEFILLALVGAYAFHYLTAGLLAIAAGLFMSFTLNEVWTYRGRLPRGRIVRFLRYNGAVFGALLLNLTFLWVLTEYGNLQYLLSNVFGMGTALSWNVILLNFVRQL
ncbi:MAG: glycosyltransferase [Candidatus Thermoplasmatota archaeon]|nr:glycosyltransferase [Candidatus Thermoplasmatota archaeon]